MENKNIKEQLDDLAHEIAGIWYERVEKDELKKILNDRIKETYGRELTDYEIVASYSIFKAILYSEIVEMYNYFKTSKLAEAFFSVELFNEQQVFEEFQKEVDKQLGINLLDRLERAIINKKVEIDKQATK